MQPLDATRTVCVASDGLTPAELDAFIDTYRAGAHMRWRNAWWEITNHTEQYSAVGELHVFDLAPVRPKPWKRLTRYAPIVRSQRGRPST